MKYDVDIYARKEGAIGTMGTEHRKVTVEAAHLDDVPRAAIDAAYKLGGLEHVQVRRIAEHGRTGHDATHNPNCDGGHCTTMRGEVRVYPIGGGANLILCHSCFAYENRFNYNRGRETGEPANWPQVNWHTAKIYGDDQ